MYEESCSTSDASFGLNTGCMYHKMCHCLESNKLVSESFDYTYYFYAFTIEFSILSGKSFVYYHKFLENYTSILHSWSLVHNVE